MDAEWPRLPSREGDFRQVQVRTKNAAVWCSVTTCSHRSRHAAHARPPRSGFGSTPDGSRAPLQLEPPADDRKRKVCKYDTSRPFPVQSAASASNFPRLKRPLSAEDTLRWASVGASRHAGISMRSISCLPSLPSHRHQQLIQATSTAHVGGALRRQTRDLHPGGRCSCHTSMRRSHPRSSTSTWRSCSHSRKLCVNIQPTFGAFTKRQYNKHCDK